MLSVQVNLRTITKNIAIIKKRLRPNTKFCAVVKADAYSFGMQRISQLINPMVDCFAVANVNEGVLLRKFGIKKDILIFGVCDDVPAAIKHQLIITINSLNEANQLIKNHWQPRLHIAVNTGMNRFGVSSIHEFRAILQILHNAKIEGCYTHLAHESNHIPQIQAALKYFQKYLDIFKKQYPAALIHAGCSGVIDYPPAHFDMVRIGKAMYGGIDGTKTAFSIKSRIIAVKKVKAGAGVGYNGEFIAEHPMVIGVVQGGYADGIHMNFSLSKFVTVDKQPCQIIGRVCMDCFFIDVSHIEKPLGKTVKIMGTNTGQTLMDVSRQTKLIACNILHGFKFTDTN